MSIRQVCFEFHRVTSLNALNFFSMSFWLLAALCSSAAGQTIDSPDAPVAAGSAVPAVTEQTVTATVPLEEAQKYVPARNIPSELKMLFRSPQIEALIKRSFKANRNVESVQAALHQAREYAAAQHGFFYSGVGTGDLPSPINPDPEGTKNDGLIYYNLDAVQLKVGYVPGVMNANNKQTDSAQAREQMLQMQLDAAYTTLASNLVATVIQEASLRAQIEAQLIIIGLNRQALEIARHQLNLGYVSEQDVTQLEMTAAQDQQALAPMQQQLEQTRMLLRVLAGDTLNQDTDKDFEEDFDEKFTLDTLLLSQELPSRLSSRLIEQRPDVRIAETQLRFAGIRYGVAITNALPKFSVTAQIGGKASSPKWMVKSGGRFFDPKGNAAQNIFGTRAVQAKSRAVQQGLAQAGAQYRSVAMTALQNMADALHVVQSDTRSLKVAAAAAREASKKGELARKQYEAGSLDFQALRVVQQHEQLATIKLVQAQTNQLGDAVLLFQALGGGWWNHKTPDVTGSK
jgi:NodT family efflux transporter outer membrane factor (OMF) lipoprotein